MKYYFGFDVARGNLITNLDTSVQRFRWKRFAIIYSLRLNQIIFWKAETPFPHKIFLFCRTYNKKEIAQQD